MIYWVKRKWENLFALLCFILKLPFLPEFHIYFDAVETMVFKLMEKAGNSMVVEWLYFVACCLIISVEPASVYNLTVQKSSTCIWLSWRHKKVRRDKVYKVNFKRASDLHWEVFPSVCPFWNRIMNRQWLAAMPMHFCP